MFQLDFTPAQYQSYPTRLTTRTQSYTHFLETINSWGSNNELDLLNDTGTLINGGKYEFYQVDLIKLSDPQTTYRWMRKIMMFVTVGHQVLGRRRQISRS